MDLLIKDLKPGDKFYFANNKSDHFIVVSIDGHSIKCTRNGKLYPVYFRKTYATILLIPDTVKL
jgi:hypothetical protein